MSTVTLSMRLPKREVQQLAHTASTSGMERSTFLKYVLRRGVREVMLEQALDAYRQGTATLSRAAEMAGLNLREFVARLPAAQVEMNYSAQDLARDLRP
jgi:predicted HTH domain antitoxin